MSGLARSADPRRQEVARSSRRALLPAAGTLVAALALLAGPAGAVEPEAASSPAAEVASQAPVRLALAPEARETAAVEGAGGLGAGVGAEAVVGEGVRAAPGWLEGIDLSGFVAVESRGFFESAAHPGQRSGDGGSLVFNPELERRGRDGGGTWSFEPFLRLDSVDPERSHFDVRELAYRRSGAGWQLTAGIGKVFWGVTESQHLVDVVNQTDLVENPDGEDKLGQPMVQLALVRDWGIVELFLLPGFRERTLPGVEGRLRPGMPIDLDRALYESAAEKWHTDWAVRWSHAVGAFDLGVSYFVGTSREPLLVPDPAADEALELVPYYPQITQAGLDAQATLGSWLLKAEAIRRTGFGAPGEGSPPADTTAATYGFEYTFWSVLGSAVDLGVLAEHLWDERGERATTPFQNDLFAGARIALNDTQSSDVLAGVLTDLDGASRGWLVEAGRRIGSQWRVELELRGFSGRRASDPLTALRTDDYLQLSVQRHF